jgi:hypothetical protein
MGKGHEELVCDGRQPETAGAAEHGGWGIYGVGSRYQAIIRVDTADWDDLVRAVVSCSVCELAIGLELVVATVCKESNQSDYQSKPPCLVNKHAAIF